ncbi:hypothetical protein LAZ67_X000125 [Cordylochernes scorpioides]|uniref:Transposase n=1 Tax=Cordylochernes scorpioides TaxID=51811 RepID=A0ABY6LRD7_9ARAC|nr:hypothetical protein LAZ67_X000125 [Cordylochernes scorpioides]
MCSKEYSKVKMAVLGYILDTFGIPMSLPLGIVKPHTMVDERFLHGVERCSTEWADAWVNSAAEKGTGISKTTIGRIVTEDLKLKKTLAKFIPRFLTNEQKLCRLATCEDMLEMTRTDPEWKDKIITGDETWVYGYDPETKRQSAEWRGQGEPRPKKIQDIEIQKQGVAGRFFGQQGHCSSRVSSCRPNSY